MPMVIKGATFDPEIDLEFVARTAVAPLVCLMTATRPQKNLSEMLAAAKTNPKEWLFAISSLGSAGHLATIEFARRTGIKFDLVPYRGTTPALTDIMGGSVQLLIDPAFALLPTAKDGTKARALGIASKARSTLAPELPTIGEQGLPGFEFNSWYGVWAPKGTPREICDKVNALMQETMREPAIVSRLTGQLLEPVAESSDDAKKFIKSEIARARELLKSVNFQPA
jgi:tripartite-type tricarboxylate transporter receptor subunit TctC